MPELPEVESLARFLEDIAGGDSVASVQLRSLSALKTYDPPIDAVVGRPLQGTVRRGKHLCMDFSSPKGQDQDPLWFVAHLARAGWLRWYGPEKAPKGPPPRSAKSPVQLRMRWERGACMDLTEVGKEKRLAVWVVRNPAEIDNVATLGPEPLDDGFTPQLMGERLALRGASHLKNALADQSVIAGIGNAYSDEILHAAKLSPYKPANKLTEGEMFALHAATQRILNEAVVAAAGLAASDLKAEKKSGLRVHNQDGKPCVVCGDTIRSVFYTSKSFQYCPTCQTGGTPLADRKTSKFLK